MKVLGYIAFLAFCLLLLYGVGKFKHHGEPITITAEAVEPDILLSNSKNYFEEHAYHRSMGHLKSAITAIRQIEQGIDDESKEKVDAAVDELEEIYNEMSHETFNIKHLNEASIKALNALTYAELKVTEHFVDSHELDKAKVALNYGMLHVKNALMFSEGENKDYETEIYIEIDSLLRSGEISNKDVLIKLENMIVDLEKPS
ncbi:MAG: hypothetical protein RIC35_24575 [Marinoscillum sp.]